MPFTSSLPEWNKTATAPTQAKKDNGWSPQEHPPASLFNWFFNTVYLALQELQAEAINTDQKGVNNGVATLDATGDLPIGQADNILNWVKGFGLGDVAKDVTGTDLNNLDGTGFYKGDNLTNGPAPAAVGLFYMVTHLKHSSTNKVQVAIRYGTGSTAGQIWQRSYINGAWSSWVQLAVYDSNGKIAVTNLPAATTAIAGISQLVDDITSTSTTKAATANSVKMALDWVKGMGFGAIAPTLAASTDLNTLPAINAIYKGTGLTNAPYTGFVHIMVFAYSSTFQVQIAHSFGSGTTGAGKTWKRQQNGTSIGWSAWEEQETTAGAQAKADAAQANLTAHTGRTDNPHGVTTKQVNEYVPAADATTSGDTVPLGITYGSIPTGATGYPAAFGTIMNIKYNGFRHVQHFFDTGNGAANDRKPRYRLFYNGAWGAWKEYATTAQESWINATLQNAWTVYSSYTAGYYKDQFGQVRLRGYITGGTKTSGTVLLTLPAGYRPSQSANKGTYGSGSVVIPIQINTAGEVKLNADITATYISLDDITFRAEQ